ncbi:tyrosyl-DNA phosphodiesterase 2 isoform X3 [Bufo gargarizans]|uniref:tyrosyl-DNA phosphodiesterase 2 isoform X3 n=1 Tax=Bufo gargarizans TaxID=30331 RepID=UPI001CF54F86|nr:tyrosyl-DNA phosphodiesterase 2 isoform X3 [Bufo gargarizans]
MDPNGAAGIPSLITERERTCAEFASIAGCDLAVAQCYLAENDWELERAINSFFEPGVESLPKEEPLSIVTKPSTSETMSVTDMCIDLTDDSPVVIKQAPVVDNPTTLNQEDESHITLLTWNVDGIDQSNLPERARGVCSYLALYSPDVIFLQEVIPLYYDYLKKRAVSYTIITGDEDGYFTAIMLKKSRVKLISQEIIPFPSTVMMRNLLVVNVDKIGGLPSTILDIWEFLGKPERCRYTWDTKLNNNLKAPYTCRLRFDRIFYRAAKDGSQVVPQSLDLIGTEKLDCGRFPSDHWGLFCDFDVIL